MTKSTPIGNMAKPIALFFICALEKQCEIGKSNAVEDWDRFELGNNDNFGG